MNIPAKVFISYSHKDEKYKDKLITHLSTLKALGLVEEWNDRMLVPGSVLHNVIDKNLCNSDIILLLISSDYVSSYSCYQDEFPKAFNKWKDGTALIVPIIVRGTASWTDLPFGIFTALPKDGKPIYNWSNKDQAYVNIIEGLRSLINNSSTSKNQITFCCPKCHSTNIKTTVEQISDNLDISSKVAIKLGKTGLFGKKMKDVSSITDLNVITFKCDTCEHIWKVRETKKN